MHYGQAGEQRKLQLQNLEAYENSNFYKENIKNLHDQFIDRKKFVVGKKFLLFNSKLKFMPCTLSRWFGPFLVTHVYPYDVVE